MYIGHSVYYLGGEGHLRIKGGDGFLFESLGNSKFKVTPSNFTLRIELSNCATGK